MDGQRLVKIFANVHGATFVGLDTKTLPRVSGALAGWITKHTQGMNVMVFQNPQWENLVNKRLKAMGLPSGFKAGPRPWGTRLPNLPIVEYADAYYLEVIVLSPGKVTYKQASMPVQKDLIPGLEDDRPSQTGVVIRCFHADSIECVHLNGMRFR